MLVFSITDLRSKEEESLEDQNIHRLTHDGKEIILIGTAHVSRESSELVERVISEEKPDTVCVELCNSRFEAIKQKKKWQETDIVKVIRKKQTSLLLSQLLMASFQKKIADKFGIKPGEEMLRAIDKAEEMGATIILADRDIRITLLRTWRMMRLWNKIKLLPGMLLSIFISEDISEEDIEKLKQGNVLELALETFGQELPEIKTALIDERDKYLAHKIENAPGSRIVAVAGAGHVPGILKNIGKEINLAAVNQIPPKSPWGKVFAWGIPAAVIGLIIAGFFYSGTQASLNMIKWWVVINSILAGLGAIAVLAHPATIAASVIAAPVTSLNPMIAAGWVAGLTEATLRKPQVKDFMDLGENITSVRGFWRNKITRILLLVAFVNLGSSIGTFVAIPLMMRFF
ncbi:MAG: TraB/GumN family protein [Proteobacteria bacterium]|nr:TraB/GumN family protein [Pseudomonadota bacterium]